MIPFDASGAFYPGNGGHQLRRLAVRGAAATVSASALALGVQVISTVILARLLTPADFGVVTMVTTFSLLLASFGLNGFMDAVIQFDEIDRYTVSNLFWLSSGAGLLLAIIFLAVGSLLVGGDLYCGALRNTPGSSEACHALRRNFCKRRYRPYRKYSTFDPAGVERLGILGSGGRNHCAAAQRDDRSLVALPVGSELAAADGQDRCGRPIRSEGLRAILRRLLHAEH